MRQARLQAEIEARQTAELEQERLRTEGAKPAPAGGAPPPPPGEAPAPAPTAAEPTSLSGRLAAAGAAAMLKWGSSFGASQASTTSSMEETSATLKLVRNSPNERDEFAE